jgi:hypothetical protein
MFERSGMGSFLVEAAKNRMTGESGLCPLVYSF